MGAMRGVSRKIPGATLLGGVAVVLVSFFGTLWIMERLSPAASDAPPLLVQLPPLPAATRTSTVIAPAAIALTAIRDQLERAAPRDFSGKPDNPVSKLLSKADIGWTVARSPLALSGRADGVTVATTLNGTLRVTGQIADQAGNITGALAGLVNSGLGSGVQKLTGKTLDQRADIRGNVSVLSRPAITTDWRLEPNLSAQVSIADANLSIAGLKLNASNEVRPLLDKAVSEQMTTLQARLRNDPFIEQAARREWVKMCRSIPLGPAGAGLPNLWLELRPTRAFAAQPRTDTNAVTLTLGIQAQTRIVPEETKPSCPFPQKLDLVPQIEQGRVNIGVPIDVPFTELNRILEPQLKNRSFPEDGSGPVQITVLRAMLAAAGERLLISLRMKATERKSWFGFGTEATIHVWGRPVLDKEQQILRLDNISLAVESEAAFGLLGAAAKAAVPYLQAALAKNAVVDLKPFAASARKSIEGAIADFRQQQDGVRVDAAVTALRLVGIEFDSKMLRVVAEADGNVRVAVNRLP
jgi:hypothetical protein